MFDTFIKLNLTLITSFFICFLAIPSIIKVAELKHLFDDPSSDRKTHGSNIPTLGGMAIFSGFIISLTFWSNQVEILELQYIIASLMFLFFMGIKDDIVNLIAHKKLLGQIVCALIIVVFADIRLTSLYGIFNIYDVPYMVSVLISLFTIVALTNSFNLIDGIDMLAAVIGIFTTSVFCTWFFLAGHYQYAILSCSLIGSLVAFLYYNKPPAKIFMGDTGSLVIGLIASVLAIKFIEFNRLHIGPSQYHISSVPAVAIGILIIPIFDTIQVFVHRIAAGKNPLNPDRNHIHYLVVEKGFSHTQTTGILLAINMMIVGISFLFQRIQGELLLLINISLMLIFRFTIRRKSKLNSKKKDLNEKALKSVKSVSQN